AGGAPHLVGRVADARRREQAMDALDRCMLVMRFAPIAVAARLREARTDEQHSRATHEPTFDRLREAPIEAEGVADAGEPGIERLLEHILDAERDRRGRLTPGLAGIGLDDRAVDVRVGETGHHRPAVAIDARGGRRDVALAAADDPDDAIAVDDDRRAR